MDNVKTWRCLYTTASVVFHEGSTKDQKDGSTLAILYEPEGDWDTKVLADYSLFR